MKKLLWLLAFLGVAYSINEVRTKGYEGAFGGVLSGQLDALEPEGGVKMPSEALE